MNSLRTEPKSKAPVIGGEIEANAIPRIRKSPGRTGALEVPNEVRRSQFDGATTAKEFLTTAGQWAGWSFQHLIPRPQVRILRLHERRELVEVL
jgi:hypothetical protein